MQRKVATPAQDRESVPDHQRPVIDHLRGLILAAAPGIREVIRWGMLSYDDDDGVLFVLGDQKQYVSLYLTTQALTDRAEQLKGLNHGKSCLRFRKVDTIPTSTIRELLFHAKGLRVRGCCDG